MPDEAPEHMKKILEMGFPGCPAFRRLGRFAEAKAAMKLGLSAALKQPKVRPGTGGTAS